MVTRKKPSRSPEERKAEAEVLHGRLTAQIEALTGTEEWMQFLRFAQSFHAYSLNNLMLILSQCPSATAVAGFRQWQAKGRQVKKGEKSLKIFGYSSKKITVENSESGEEEERKIARFPILSVFDIAQTEPIEGAGAPVNPVERLTGEDPAGIAAKVVTYLQGIGWTVDREVIAGETNGYTTTDGSKRVVIDADLAPAQAAKTAIHEAAHVLMHAAEDPREYVAHRGIKETEAESVAYVVAGMLGLDTSAYSVGYVAHWSAADLDLIKSTAANVLTTVHILAEALIGDEQEQAA